jgi:inorganic pyrophosphatase
MLQGDITTTEWRMFFTEGGKPISPWHDIPLKAGEGVYNFVCEIPKDTMAKMECCLVREFPASLLPQEHLSIS